MLSKGIETHTMLRPNRLLTLSKHIEEQTTIQLNKLFTPRNDYYPTTPVRREVRLD